MVGGAHLHVGLVVQAGDALHEVRRRVVAEVRADIANAQPAAVRHQVAPVVVRRLVQHVDLSSARHASTGTTDRRTIWRFLTRLATKLRKGADGL